MEKGERVREELDERRRRREEEEAERVAFVKEKQERKSDSEDDQKGEEEDSTSAAEPTTTTVEEEDLRCALRVLGVLARGERELADLQTQPSHPSHSPNTSTSSLPLINYTATSSSSYSQGRSTFTSSLTPPTKHAWTPQEHATLRRMEANLHKSPRLKGPLGGGTTMGHSTTTMPMGLGGGMGLEGVGVSMKVEEPRPVLPSRAEGGGW